MSVLKRGAWESERCEIGCRLVLFTNKKSHTGFRLPNSVALGADYVKVVEDRPIRSATEM